MPRRARLSIPGIPWHIIQRGNNRSVCFHAEEDYQLYLHHLRETVVCPLLLFTDVLPQIREQLREGHAVVELR